VLFQEIFRNSFVEVRLHVSAGEALPLIPIVVDIIALFP